MKKIIFVLLISLFPMFLLAQAVTEKSICKIENIGNLDVYSLKYDAKTGTYVYVYYDSTKLLKNSIISNKGNSGDYDFINSYVTQFDDEGNYYLVAYISINDTSGRNALIKNGKEIITCDYINSETLISDGKVYMMCTDNGKSFITAYSISDNTLSKGKEYDEVILCQFDKNVYEGEPIGKIGITKDGKIYYIAKLNNKTFMVTGDEEQMQFTDIDAYSVTEDKSGKFAYVAKDTGSFMNPGGNFVVYGNQRYNAFYSIYNLITDEKGNAIYLASDYSADFFPQRVMMGNKAISKTYNGGIYNLNLTPDGKLYYIANETKGKAENYESFLVYDGKEHKKYLFVMNPKIYPGNRIVYAAQISEDRYAVVDGTKEIPIGKKLSVQSADLLADGTLAFVYAEFGDYEKNIKDKYYIQIGEKKYGPYDGMQILDYEKNSFTVSDEKGNFAYLVNIIKGYTDYIYVLYTNTGKSQEYDNISDVHFYNGKVLYMVSYITDKENYVYKYKIYYDNKPITPEYDGITEFKLNEKTGIVTYFISRGNEIYKVEIKL